ncbi:hypothetical protein MNBD_NITROSPIRAE02-1584 [hydrothermal vent metagenome]|uniref:Uncharacterized protein n=1 Tax=hydrothermal vent metagenome TaxID=652676 RepID=A0A3B1CJJ1_9ZZZZ
MEKNRLLDITHKTLEVLLIFMFAIFLSSCSLPRIVVIDDPLSPEEHINLGVIYEKKGQYDEAISEYKKASETLPVAYLYMGNASFLKGDFKGAEQFYRRAIREDSMNADAMNNLAWLYYKWGKNLDEAEALVKRAIEIRPERADAYRDTLVRIEEEK